MHFLLYCSSCFKSTLKFMVLNPYGKGCVDVDLVQGADSVCTSRSPRNNVKKQKFDTVKTALNDDYIHYDSIKSIYIAL